MRWRFDTERLCPPSWRKGLFSSFTIPGGSFVDAREYKPGHDTTDRCSFSVRSSYPLSKVIRLLNTRKLEPFVYFRGGGGCLRFFEDSPAASCCFDRTHPLARGDSDAAPPSSGGRQRLLTPTHARAYRAEASLCRTASLSVPGTAAASEAQSSLWRGRRAAWSAGQIARPLSVLVLQ